MDTGRDVLTPYGIRTDEDYGQRAYTGSETMIHYAMADKPLGPYHLPGDPTLFRGNASPYVIDLVHDGGEVESGRAGWLTRYDREARMGCVVLVDPNRKELQFAQVEPLYNKGIFLRVLERHHITSHVGAAFKSSVVHSRDYQMVFVNEVLAATFSFARRDAGVVDLFLENATGKCVVTGLHARQP